MWTSCRCNRHQIQLCTPALMRTTVRPTSFPHQITCGVASYVQLHYHSLLQRVTGRRHTCRHTITRTSHMHTVSAHKHPHTYCKKRQYHHGTTVGPQVGLRCAGASAGLCTLQPHCVTMTEGPEAVLHHYPSGYQQRQKQDQLRCQLLHAPNYPHPASQSRLSGRPGCLTGRPPSPTLLEAAAVQPRMQPIHTPMQEHTRTLVSGAAWLYVQCSC